MADEETESVPPSEEQVQPVTENIPEEAGDAQLPTEEAGETPVAGTVPVGREVGESVTEGGTVKDGDAQLLTEEAEETPTAATEPVGGEEDGTSVPEGGEAVEGHQAGDGTTPGDDDQKQKQGHDGDAEPAPEGSTGVAITVEVTDGETAGEEVPGDGGVTDENVVPPDGEPDSTTEVPGTAEGGIDVTGEAPGDTSTREDGEADQTSPLPDSGTFQDGERPETPTVQVPEPLSREGSPTQEPEHLDAGTPEAEESPRAGEVMEDVEEEEEPLFSREELMEAYQAALAEKDQLQTHNTQLQHRLAEYFKKKKSDDQRQEMDKNVTDQEQRYLKYMSNLEELRNQEADERESFHLQLEEPKERKQERLETVRQEHRQEQSANLEELRNQEEDERESFHHQLEELKERKQERLETVRQEHDHFTDLKKTVASEAISSRTGKPLMPREVEVYISNELKKEDEVKVVRLENIKLKNRLKKREQQLKAKEELAEGLHLIDFEQLKIENQTYNEKIEERNEELLKFRKKITSTVQVLTHVKEKLQFVQAENQVQKVSLREVEAHVALKRDLLSRTKKARDSLRIDNQRLRQRCGLLGNETLLRDFEERKDEGEDLRGRLDKLKRQHAELVLKTAGVKKKIDEARA